MHPIKPNADNLDDDDDDDDDDDQEEDDDDRIDPPQSKLNEDRFLSGTGVF